MEHKPLKQITKKQNTHCVTLWKPFLIHKSIFIFYLLFNILVFGQNSLTTVIRYTHANELFSGVTAKIKGTNNCESEDRYRKVIIKNITNGNQTIMKKSMSWICFRFLFREKHFLK